jgi:hypothetical protein
LEAAGRAGDWAALEAGAAPLRDAAAAVIAHIVADAAALMLTPAQAPTRPAAE